jgi:hypothetical protein
VFYKLLVLCALLTSGIPAFGGTTSFFYRCGSYLRYLSTGKGVLQAIETRLKEDPNYATLYLQDPEIKEVLEQALTFYRSTSGFTKFLEDFSSDPKEWFLIRLQSDLDLLRAVKNQDPLENWLFQSSDWRHIGKKWRSLKMRGWKYIPVFSVAEQTPFAIDRRKKRIYFHLCPSDEPLLMIFARAILTAILEEELESQTNELRVGMERSLNEHSNRSVVYPDEKLDRYIAYIKEATVWEESKELYLRLLASRPSQSSQRYDGLVYAQQFRATLADQLKPRYADLFKETPGFYTLRLEDIGGWRTANP